MTAEPDAGYKFSNWSGDASGSTNPLTITMTGDKSVTASFQEGFFSLTINSTHGSVTKSPSKSSYSYDESVTLTAKPDAGYAFSGWSGDTSGSTLSTTITMTEDKTVTASFTPLTYTLTLSSTNGSVNKSPDKSQYDHGDAVTLTAIPDTGYQFANWSGSATGTGISTTVTMTENKTITAIFTAKPYYLTLTSTHGSILKSPDKSSYAYNETVTLKAVSDTGYRFTGWAGDASGTQDSVTVTIVKDTSVTAMFEEAAFTVDVTVSPASSGTVFISPDKSSYTSGETIALNAETATGSEFVFDHWEGDYSGTRAATTLPVTKDLKITAVFISVNELAVTPSKLEVTSQASELLAAVGGTAPYTWSASSGNLTPDTGPKVSYQAPAAPGTYTVTLSDSRSVTADCTITVYNNISVSPSVHTMEIAETADFEVSGGKSPYTVSVTDGSASSVSDGSGTFVYTAPDEAGKVTLTIKDQLEQQVSVSVTVSKDDPLTVTPETVTLRPGEDVSLTATGVDAPNTPGRPRQVSSLPPRAKPLPTWHRMSSGIPQLFRIKF